MRAMKTESAREQILPLPLPKGENGAVGKRDMAGKAVRVAVERCGRQPRYNEGEGLFLFG
jgi:hypothetical protein